MATSPLLRLTLQEFNTNANLWGDILNDSALQLLEDAVAATTSVTLVGEATYTLTDLDGSTSEARAMILNIGGTSAAPTDVVVPTRSKAYLVSNTSDDSIEVRTAAGTGPTIVTGEAQWVFCDGTNVLAASAATAVTAGTATLATNAEQLIGVAGANYANKTAAGQFTAGQVTVRDDSFSPLNSPTSTLQINCALSNSFYVLVNNSFTLQAPTNASDGQQFSLAIQQGAGGPHTIAFASSTFVSAGGASITLSTIAGEIDYLGFERIAPSGGLAAPFNTGDSTRWVVSQLKNLGDI